MSLVGWVLVLLVAAQHCPEIVACVVGVAALRWTWVIARWTFGI